MATPKKKKAKKAAPKKAAAALYDGPKDYRGYCFTDSKPINKRWKTREEAITERDAHKAATGHDVDIEERQ
jgi:hypothetical protein